jgi:hypothetical protein
MSASACAAPEVPAEEEMSAIACAAPEVPAEEEMSASACATPAAPAEHEVSAAASVAAPTVPIESEDAFAPECVREATEIAAAAAPEAEDTERPIADADENAAVIPEIAATSPCAAYVPAQDIAPRAPRAVAATGSSEVSIAKTIAVTPPAAIASAPTSFEERRRSRELKRVPPDRLSRYAGVAAIVAMIVAMALVSSGVSGGFADFLPLGPTDSQPS